MTTKTNTTIKTELAVLGSGLTGFAAALFATNRGIPTVLAGQSKAIGFASGLMDLLGVHPGQASWDDPWAGMEQLRIDIPGHPYARIENKTIRQSFQEVHDFLNDQGLAYRKDDSCKNVNTITSLGSMKKSYMVPEGMWHGIVAFEKKPPALLVDFAGLKIYSAKQIASSLSEQWPGLRAERIEFPGTEHLEELHGEHLARSLDLSANRVKLAERVKPLIKDAECIGFPAVLGMYRSKETIEELEELLGLPVFEIPTPPVSVPGVRLKETLSMGLEKRDLLQELPLEITGITPVPGEGFRITLGTGETEKTVEAKAVILATGRFLGKGLTAERTGIRESLLDLPVHQPQDRKMWHKKDLFDPQGHPVNQAGIETDSMFRPVNGASEPVLENLFCAGSILAHSDWTRLKSGAGVAIATALAAVNAFEKTTA
ncbi:MAG: anaerobic glycerol-3-phosphate dehydrogenase subunit B [Desulfobacteraceae bacterium]|nr:anaerobic glycerol-3-phosphate dehydrogenase subunit B [Desulfobacteraceae bacterium]